MPKPEYLSKWVKNILHIFDFIYRQNYYFIRARNYDEYKDILKNQLNCIVEDKKDIGGKFNVFTQGKHKTEVCFIWANNKRDLVHECFHAVSYTLRHRGLPLTDDTDEAFAYSIS